MMIIDPVALGDVACTRASTATYFDRNGVLQTAPANTLRVTYDPSDLTKAPYALVELAASNLFLNSGHIGAWTYASSISVTSNSAIAPDGTTSADLVTNNSGADFASIYQVASVTPGANYTVSIFAKAAASSRFDIRVISGSTDGYVSFDVSSGAILYSQPGMVVADKLTPVGGGWFRAEIAITAQASSLTAYLYPRTQYASATAGGMYYWGGQLESGVRATSYAPTTYSAVTRIADTIAPGAGLAYSNVAITETAYSSTATYAQNAIVYDPATYLTYQSLIANNTGKVLSDTASWTPLGVMVNRWLMLDQYNNTQTSNAEEIIVALSPAAISQGVYLGNVDASEVRMSVVDLTAGLAYQEVQNLIVSNSASSFYNWSFKPIKRKSYAVSVLLPPYANALVTIAIKKPGGTAKCGMCVVGPVVDVGLSQYGLSREIKDYSTVNFNVDGTSNVVRRNYAKVMDVDVIISNDQIDSVIERLEGYRQKPLAWLGAVQYGHACMFGPYVSFKSVIAYPTESTMNLQIQATV